MNNKIKSDIARVRKLEVKAQKLQTQLNAVRRKWSEQYDNVHNTQEWKDDCNHYGICHDYNFYDLLA